MDLSKVETDFIGDLNQDTHGCWEVFEFVRLHCPELKNGEVFRKGLDILEKWTDRGWITIAENPVSPSEVTSLPEMLKIIKELGKKATFYFVGAPSIDITEKAQKEVSWLSAS